MSKTYLIGSTMIQKSLALIVVLALSVMIALPVKKVEAAALTNLSDTMSSLSVGATSSHTMRFVTTSGAATSTATIVITFPASYDFTGKSIASVSLTHGPSTGLEFTETLSAASSATNWGAVFSGTANRILTLTPPTDGVGTSVLAPNNRVIITYSAASSTNPTTPGSYTVSLSGGFGDVGDMTNVILSNDVVYIDAVVPQSLTFTISTTTINFGTLSTVATRYASSTGPGSASEVEAHNIVVSTNATNGYTITASGTTLTYDGDTITPIGDVNTPAAAGTEQFGIRAVASGGIGTVSAPYAASGFAFATSSFPSVLATATGSTPDTTYSVRYLANIAGNTEAGVYTATLAYVATANF